MEIANIHPQRQQLVTHFFKQHYQVKGVIERNAIHNKYMRNFSGYIVDKINLKFLDYRR